MENVFLIACIGAIISGAAWIGSVVGYGNAMSKTLPRTVVVKRITSDYTMTHEGYVLDLNTDSIRIGDTIHLY